MHSQPLALLASEETACEVSRSTGLPAASLHPGLTVNTRVIVLSGGRGQYSNNGLIVCRLTARAGLVSRARGDELARCPV